MSQERIDFLRRALLGIGLGASLAAFLAFADPALAATVDLQDPNYVVLKAGICALLLGYVLRYARTR